MTMRWIIALAALATGTWYLSNRQRRARIQEIARNAAPPSVRTQAEQASTSLGDTVGGAASAAADHAKTAASAIADQAKNTADTVTEGVKSAAAPVAEQGQGLGGTAAEGVKGTADAARQAVGNAAAQATETSASVTDQVGQAADAVKSATSEPAHAGSAVETDVNTPPPSMRETTRAEMADVGEQVDTLRAQSEEPPDPAEKSVGTAFGLGTVNATDLHIARAPDSSAAAAPTTGGTVALSTENNGDAPAGSTGAPPQSQSDPNAVLPTHDKIVSEGQRPRPIAGDGTTTAAGGMVDALSPDADGATAIGQSEPLPAGLTPGEPGTGGPATSTIAPTVPNPVESPTVGMEQLPVVDRASNITTRTSGAYVANKKTRIFHAASSGNLPGEDNRVYFESAEEAVTAGFRPAENEDLESAGS